MESTNRQPDVNVWNLGDIRPGYILWHLEQCRYLKSLSRKRLLGLEGPRKEAEFWSKSASNL